jgi:hypothetical protein
MSYCENYIEEKLNNWGRWMCIKADGGLGCGNSPLARMGGASASASAEAQCVIPIDEVDASKTDDAINSLPKRLRDVAQYWYAENMTNEQVRKAMGFGSTTTVRTARESLVFGVRKYFDELAERKRITQALGARSERVSLSNR